MKRCLALLVLLTLPALSCDRTEDGPSIEDQIRSCIESGGDPKFTSNRHGYPVEYFGCVK